MFQINPRAVRVQFRATICQVKNDFLVSSKNESILEIEYTYIYIYIRTRKRIFTRKSIKLITNLARGKGRRCRNYPGKNSDVSTCGASRACSRTKCCRRTGPTSIGCCKCSTCSASSVAPTDCNADDWCSGQRFEPGSCSWASAATPGRRISTGTRAFEVNRAGPRSDCSSRSYCISGSRGTRSSWNVGSPLPPSPHHWSGSRFDDYSLASGRLENRD